MIYNVSILSTRKFERLQWGLLSNAHERHGSQMQIYFALLGSAWVFTFTR